MSEFNEFNWCEALAAAYEKSRRDPVYRLLCQNDPVTAIKEVSEIELPDWFKFQFFATREDYVYTYLLPPVASSDATADEQMSKVIQWAAVCTNPTTNTFPN